MYHRIFGGEVEDIKDKVMQNARIGLDPALHSRVLDMDPPERTTEGLTNLQASYKKALAAELEMPMSTMEKKLTIETAMSAPTMNLSLISDRTVRETLNKQWQDIALGGLPGTVGLPSVPSSSGNIRSESVYANMPDSDHPSAVIMSGRAISVSNEKVGEGAMTVSSANIPTVEYLETMIARRRAGYDGAIKKAINDGRKLKIMTSDIETGGVGPYDLARSVFGQTYEMPTHLPGATLGTALDGLAPTSDTFEFHMLLPEMQTLTRGQRGGAPSVKLGGRLAEIETGRFLPGGRTAAGSGKIFDLTTKVGRTESALELTKYLESIADKDTMLLGNNFVHFDIPKLIATASSLPEFMENPRAREIIKAVQDKAGSDSVIDVTEMSRQYLSGKIRERMASSGLPDEQLIQSGLTSLLSQESLMKAGIVGEGVKPFSIENMVTSTNVLEQMYDSSVPGMQQAVLDLAGGSHIASLDAQLSMSLFSGMAGGTLDIIDPANRPDLSTDRGQAIARALNAVSRASATVPTSNIASMGEISDQVFNFLTDTSGTSDATLIGARVQTIDHASGQVDGFIHYNPKIAKFEKVSTDGTAVALGGRAGAADTAVSRTINRNAGLFEIRQAMAEENTVTRSDGSTYIDYGSRVISTGINVTEASQMNSTLAAVSRFSGLSTVARGPGAFLSTEADEDAFVGAMTATRKHIGFPHLRDRPDAVTRGSRGLVANMRGRFEMPTEAAMAAAQDAVYEGGAGLAVLDPIARARFVAISAQTSHIPFQDGFTEMATEVARRSVAQKALEEGRVMTNDQIEALVSTMNAEQIRSVNTIAATSSTYLSEQTISHIPVMKRTRLISSKTGRATKPLISQSVLSQMQVKEGGKSVPIVESAFWKKAGLDTSTLSIVKINASPGGEERNIVNLVAGKGGMSRSDAKTFTDSLLDVLRSKKDLTAEEMFDEGLAYSVEEARQIKELLHNATPEGPQRLKKFSEDLVERLTESGPAIGATEGPVAQGLTAILEAAGSEVGNDQPAIDVGMVFQTQRMGEETISFSGALPQAAKDQLTHMGGAQSAAVNAELGGNLMEEHLQALGKADSSKTFRDKLKKVFSKDRVDTGIFGTSIGRNRRDRDISILESLEKVKPKLLIGAIAVGAASAGYYLAKKQRSNKMYDETMHQQPYENQGLVQEANSGIQQDNQQTSARRDPLVTAGVVGNLDRNKIGHTGMGPNKYNHLYGG
jgi:hypothetical protein